MGPSPHIDFSEMYVSVPCKLSPGMFGDPMGASPKSGYGAAANIMQVLQRPGLESTSVLSRTFLVGLLYQTEPPTM